MHLGKISKSERQTLGTSAAAFTKKLSTKFELKPYSLRVKFELEFEHINIYLNKSLILASFRLKLI